MNGSLPSRATAARQSGVALILGFTALWIVLWRLGFPFPNGDDAFFSGAAIHLSRTGQLANPWITGWMPWIPGVHLDRFYVQLPFPVYALAAWLQMAGVSTAAMTGYACIVGGAGSIAGALLLRRLGAGLAAATLGGLIVATYVLHRGLRPEPLGIALLLAGQTGLLARTALARFSGTVALLAAPLCHAFLLTLAVPLLLLSWWIGPDAPARRAHLLRLAGAGALLAVAFALAVRGEFGAFVHDFTGHAKLVTPERGQKLALFGRQLTVGWTFVANLGVLGLCAALVLREWMAPSAPRVWLWRSAAGFLLFAALGVGLYAPFAAIYVVMVATFTSLAWSVFARGRLRWALLAPAAWLVAAECAAQGLHFTINHRAQRTDTAAIARYIETARPNLVLFDSFTLRYVFDFRPPAGSTDIAWCWSPGRSARWWSPHAIEPRDLWVQHVRPGLLPPGDTSVSEPPRVFGRRFGSIRIEDAAIVIAGDGLPVGDGKFPLFFARDLQRFRPIPNQ